MPLEIGQTVGQYQIMSQIGQGGMATVYKAYHAGLDRFVAIKVLHPAFKDDDTFYFRFQREAQIVAKLDHPYIVPIYDFDANSSDPYLVMKFIEGETLKRRMKRKSLSLAETQSILGAVAQALTFAHDRGILHRDVKPSNVMLDENEIPYLADFGLARIASSGESTMSQDVLIGTPNYISPEQARGTSLTAATDIYSLGIMLYEIVVGRVPFSADTPYAVVHDHIYKPLPIPSHVNPDVPPQIERVLLKSLAKDPTARYGSAVQMMQDFEQAAIDAQISELSVTNLRVERLSASEPTPATVMEDDPTLNQATGSTPAPDEITTSMREIAKAMEELKQLKSQVETQSRPAIESAIPSQISNVDTRTLRRKRRRRRRNFWILSGIAALVFICIGSLAITIQALENPIVQSNPALAQPYPDETDNFDGTPIGQFDENTLLALNMTLEEVEEWVAEEPENPIAYLTLALRQLDRGETEAALNSVAYAIDDLQASGELLAQAAAVTAAQGYTDEASMLWLAAYHAAPQSELIRNSAGQYLYQQINDMSVVEITQLNILLRQTPYADSPFTKALIAQGYISTSEVRETSRLSNAKTLLDEALEAEGSFAEAELVYGNYYLALDEPDNAREAWRFAASFADSPAWVQREADNQMQKLETN